MEEYLAYWTTFWKYFNYIFYTYVILTLLTKSLRKIKNFANADYEANRHKYHRCYGPELCCHNFIENEVSLPKAKQRKSVSRGYTRKQQNEQPPTTQQVLPIKRQVPVSAIQTNTNVNQIAKMFECGTGVMAHKKTIHVLPEIRTTLYHNHQQQHTVDKDADGLNDDLNETAHNEKMRFLLGENLETTTSTTKSSETATDNDDRWQSRTSSFKRRTRTVPNTLTYAGTSATPSTASPAASSSPSPPNSPVLRASPILNLKTSVEDLFAAIAHSAEKNDENYVKCAGCNTLSPVTSIDDILSQRRLSRPLSAYSISDLLNEDANLIYKLPTSHHTTPAIQLDATQEDNNNKDQDLQQTSNINDENLFHESLLVTALESSC